MKTPRKKEQEKELTETPWFVDLRKERSLHMIVDSDDMELQVIEMFYYFMVSRRQAHKHKHPPFVGRMKAV